MTKDDEGPVEPVAAWKPEEPLTPVPGYSPPAVSSAASSVPPSLFDFHRACNWCWALPSLLDSLCTHSSVSSDLPSLLDFHWIWNMFSSSLSVWLSERERERDRERERKRERDHKAYSVSCSSLSAWLSERLLSLIEHLMTIGATTGELNRGL